MTSPRHASQYHLDDSTIISVADDSSEDDSSHSEGDSDGDNGILRPCIQMLGLSRYYVASWSRQDAFRELYQNWKDAIIGSFNLDPRSFTPLFKETPGQIQIMVHQSQTTVNGEALQRLLGFIRFNKKAGSLELTNFQAEMDLEHLTLGGSTKRGRDEFAGIHGEGFKLAALVLRRCGHSIRFAASSYYWNFGFRGRYRSNLYCRLSQAKPEKVETQKRRYADKIGRPKFKRGLTSNIWEDVTVKISKAQGDDGIPILEDEFRSWLQVAIELNAPEPAQVIRTKHGDLLLDQRFVGLIYLKGLQISGHGTSYAFGYNFVHGTVNRDRDRLANSLEEEEALSQIWEESILERGPEITDAYIRLLQDRKDCAEISWTCEKMSILPVKVVWRRLRSSNQNAFFHSEGEPSEAFAADQANIIRKELKKEPFPVSAALWALLRKFSLALTPLEERTRRFSNSRLVSLDKDPFRISIFRALKASMMLSSTLKSLRIQFLEGGGTELDLMFHKQARLVQVHEKWLDFQRAHEGTTCEVLRLTQAERIEGKAFFCDHVVEDLFDLVLTLVCRASEISMPAYRAHRQLARECLRLMPRLVQVTQKELNSALEVSWVGNESGLISEKHGSHVRYHVTLHKESSCGPRLGDVLYRGGATPTDPTLPQKESCTAARASIRCDCAHQIVPRITSKAHFDGLDSHEKYFPMVARAEEISFFGAPPEPVAPKAASVGHYAPPTFANRPTTTNTIQSSSLGRKNVETRNSYHLPAGCSQSERRAPPQSRQGDTVFSNEDTALSERDEQEWHRWHKHELPREFSKLGAHREHNKLHPCHSIASLDCPHLNFCFEKGEYARIGFGADGSPEHPVFIHNIYYQENELDTGKAHLLVTKYSMLESTYPFQNQTAFGNRATTKKDQEVLLHFEDFDRMGMQDDAEVIKLGDVAHAGNLIPGTEASSSYIDHLSQRPQDLESCPMFCRFAIRAAGRENEACLTPVASHLLRRQDRWKELKFSSPFRPNVFDFTPKILGASEGFSQAGFNIQAGLEFDPERHLTWKIRHWSSQVYDGSPKCIFEDLDCGHLHPPTMSQQTPPKVALVAGGNGPFRLYDKNQDMPSLRHFLTLLDKVDLAAHPTMKPDFLVMLSSPALFHPSAIGRFAASLLSLLGQRLSVHLKLCSLRDHGFPLERNILILIASPSCAALPWDAYWPAISPSSSNTIQSLINDLAFDNPRAATGSSSAFLCSHPSPRSSGVGLASQGVNHVYNHQTGQLKLPSQVPLQWDAKALPGLTAVPKTWGHPSRQDLLTVREIARLLGFPDDFIFYQSERVQYKDVWTALPPVISKLVGMVILRVIRSSLAVKIGGRVETSKGFKRVRRDSESHRDAGETEISRS